MQRIAMHEHAGKKKGASQHTRLNLQQKRRKEKILRKGWRKGNKTVDVGISHCVDRTV